MANDTEQESEGSVRAQVLGADTAGDDEDWGTFTLVNKSSFLAAGISGEEIQTTNAKPIEDSLARQTFRNAGALLPPFDPETLCRLLENSGMLRQNIDAYITNIDAFGHRLEPVFDLQADDVDEKISSALTLEKLIEQEEMIAARAMTLDGPGEGGGVDVEGLTLQVPEQLEIEAKKEQIRVDSLLEEHRINSLFTNCSYEMSFVTLRRRTRMDLELMGNAYWEVQRNRLGRIAQFTYLYGFTMRLIPLDRDFVEVPQRVQVSPLKWEKRMIRRRFRRFVQIYENQVVYFKEFGDPRVISSRSGRVYKTIEDLRTHDPMDPPATEVLHFKIHSPRSPYGVPRWAGAILSVLGSRQADEINFMYFDNKAVPPLAILVSGGRLAKGGQQKIEDVIKEKIKKKKNFHNILVIEAESAGSNGPVENIGRMKIELKPLTDAMQKDALFMNYGERNSDVLGQTFRLPRLLRGDIRDFNKATAQAAKDFTEEQVFHPEREEFDWIMDTALLGDLGIRYWKFRSNAPPTRDPERLAGIVAELCDAGVLTPEEARQISADVFNRALKKINAPWTKQPIALTVAGVPFEQDAMPGDGLSTPDPIQDPNEVTEPLGGADSPVLPAVQPAIEQFRAAAGGGAAPAPQAAAGGLPDVSAVVQAMREHVGKGGKLNGKAIRKIAIQARKTSGNKLLDTENLLAGALQIIQLRDSLEAVEAARDAQRYKAQRTQALETEVVKVKDLADWFEKEEQAPTNDLPPAG